MNKKLKKIGRGLLVIVGISCFIACQKSTVFTPADGTGTSVESSENSGIVFGSDSTLDIDSSKFVEAKDFPGLVGEAVKRVEDYQIEFDFNYAEVENNLRIAKAPEPLFSTGLYAPAGEKIIVDVPADISHLYIQIGAWTDNLAGELSQDRSPLIYTKSKLTAGKNTLRNLYGGPIYIYASQPIAQKVKLSFSGAVEMPDFVLNKTDASQWWNKVKDNNIPWLELRSEWMILTVPREKIIESNIDNPTALLNFWDKVVKKDIYDWTDLDKNAIGVNQAPSLPLHIVLDKQVQGGGFGHAGSPVFVTLGNNNFKAVTDENQLASGDFWDILGLLGENEIQPKVWTWDGVKDAASKIFSVHAIHRLGKGYHDLNADLAAVVSDALQYASEFSSLKDFKSEKHSEAFKIIPFIQIFEKAPPVSEHGENGFDFIPFLYKRGRQLNDLPLSNQDKRDFFYETLSNFMGKDTKTFFNAWGIKISSDALNAVETKGYDLLKQTIWTYNPINNSGGDGQLSDAYFYVNTNWSIYDFNSQDLTGEGGGNGPVANIIDGNIDSYWHTNYGKGEGDEQPAFYVVVDMQKELAVKSFTFTQRQTGGNPRRIKNLEVSISNDGNQWNIIDTFLLANEIDPQGFNLESEQTFRYFRLRINKKSDVWDGLSFASLAEVEVSDTAVVMPDKGYYDTQDWTAEASSEYGENGSGLATSTLDGKYDTYWTSAYPRSGPFWLSVDMQQPLEVAAIFLVNRQTNQNTHPRNIVLYTSDNGDDWNKVDDYTLDVKDLGPQRIELPSPQTFQYFKIEIPSKSDVDVNGGVEPSIAEVWAGKKQ